MDKKNYFIILSKFFFLIIITFSIFFSLQSKAALLDPTKPIDEDLNSFFSRDFITNDLINNSSNSEVSETWQKGLDLIKAGDTNNGIANLYEVWEIIPNFVSAGVVITMTHLNLREYDKALKTTKKLQKLYPALPVGYTLEGVAYAALKQHDQAKKAFEKGYLLQSGDLNSGVNLAKYAVKDKQYDKARKLYSQILDQNPDSTSTAISLAKLEFSLNNSEQAINLLEQTLLKHPKDAQVRDLMIRIYFTAEEYKKVLSLSQGLSEKDILAQPSIQEFRGKAQSLTGDSQASIKSFKKLITELPDSAPAHFMLAKAYFQSNNLDEALVETTQAIKLDPKYLPARIAEIKILSSNGKTKQAKQGLTVLQNDFKNNLDVMGVAGWLAMKNGEYPEATKQFEKILKQQPSSTTTQLLFTSLAAQKHYEDGVKVLESWLMQYPKDTVLRSLLADTYLGLNRKEEAITTYSKVIELAPNYAQAHNNLAFLLQDKNLTKAIMLAEKAHQLDNKNTSIKDTLGTLLIKNGQLKKGTLILKEATQLTPENHEIQYQYAKALLKQDQNSTTALTILQEIIKKHPKSQTAIEAQVQLNALH